MSDMGKDNVFSTICMSQRGSLALLTAAPCSAAASCLSHALVRKRQRFTISALWAMLSSHGNVLEEGLESAGLCRGPDLGNCLTCSQVEVADNRRAAMELWPGTL